MARPRTGSLYWAKSGWRARLTVDVDGERVQKSFDLGTTDKSVARRKLKRLQAERTEQEVVLAPGAVPAKPETFREAAVRVVDAQVLSEAERKSRTARLGRYVYPEIGPMLLREQRGKNPDGTPYFVDLIRPAHLTALLETARDQGKSRQTLVHIRKDLSTIFGVLRREEVIRVNPVELVAVPELLPAVAEASAKERAVLDDVELARYLAWQHPDETFQMATLERQVMACVCRMFGGLRTGDLHALRWEAFDVAEGALTWGWAPRKKTRRPQLLEVPEMLRPILRDWWERAGRPQAGLLFASRRGERAGEARIKSSHAKAFRRDLMRAFGIEVPEVTTTVRSNGRPLTKTVWKRACDAAGVELPLTARQRELFEETEYTLPVDFHSWRRAYSQALAEANVNEQQARGLTGHASLSAHTRYLANTAKMRALPAAALPQIEIRSPEVSASPMQKLRRGRSRNQHVSQWAGQGLNLRHPACKASALPLSYPPEGKPVRSG